MARIRTVKPEFWTDEKVGECSASARLLFIATWNFADDHGGLDRSSKQIKAQAFPYDKLDCEPLIKELLEVGVLVEYESAGKKYLHIKNFQQHQKIDKPSKPRVPLYEDSLKTPRTFDEPSGSPRPSSLGREGSLKEGKGNKTAAAPPAGLNIEAWDRWTRYRTDIRRTIKPASMLAAQKQLAGFGADQAAVVERSIASGWQGLFPLKSNGSHRAEKPVQTWRPPPDEPDVQH